MPETTPPVEQPSEPSSEQPAEPQEPSLQEIFDAFFAELDRGFSAELDKTLKRLGEARGALEQEVGKAQAELARSRTKLLEAGAGIEAKGPVTDAQLRQFTATIESQMTLIFRRVRPAVDRELRPFSPRREPLAALLRRVEESYLKAAHRLPDQVREVAAPLPPPPGTPLSLANLWAQVRHKTAQLTGEAREVAEKNLRLTPRNLVEEYLSARPGVDRHRLVQAYRKAFEETQTRLSDIWRGARFHLEIVLDDLNAAEEADLADSKEGTTPAASLLEARDLAAEVLADAEAKLADGLKPLTALLDSLAEGLRLDHRELTAELRDSLEHVDSWGAVTEHTLRWSLRRVKGLVRDGQALIAQGRDEVTRSASSSLAQTGNLLRNLQTLLGKGTKTAEALLDLADLPTGEQILDRADRLPGLYRRLFTLGPLKNREFLVARDEELEELEEALKRWEQGKVCSVAVIGPEGSGKTSLLNCFESEFGNRGELLRTELRRRLTSEAELLEEFRALLGAPEPCDLAALTAHLNSGPRRILIVEGGHCLGLRVIDGLGAARAFLQLVMATHRHCLWLVSFRKYPWQRLDYQLGISQFFTHQVRTLLHDQAEMREAILLRHRTAGLPLSYLASSESETEETQKALEERYFRNLVEVSSGNLEAAIYCWLLSLDYRNEDNTITVAPLGRPDHGLLRALGRDALFALAEVVSNGGLSIEEHGRIFQCDAVASRMTLDYLAHLNLVRRDAEEHDDAVRYALNPIFFGPVTRVLESMNILY